MYLKLKKKKKKRKVVTKSNLTIKLLCINLIQIIQCRIL